MVGVTQSLRRTLSTIILVYLAAGCTAIGVSSYFLSTPNKRRQVILSTEQLHVALAIGVLMLVSTFIFFVGLTTKKLGSLSLKFFNVMVIVISFMTLGLGAYAWFQSLDIKGSYESRWQDWPESSRKLFQDEGHCCGYKDIRDHPAVSKFCTAEVLAQGIASGCAKSMYTFVIAYLQRIYTALFLFTCVNFVSLLGSLVMIRAIKDQGRYEKSMRKMINLHNLEDLNMVEYNDQPSESPYSDASQPHSQHTLPQITKRSSVIYSDTRAY